MLHLLGEVSQSALTHDEQSQIDFEALRETGFYGKAGAGALIFCSKTKRYLLAHRSDYVEQPDTWGIWGGAISQDEKPLEAVKREMEEELGVHVQYSKPKLAYIFKSGTFQYFNYLVTVKEEFEPRLNWETKGFAWLTADQVKAKHSALHFGVQELIKHGVL